MQVYTTRQHVNGCYAYRNDYQNALKVLGEVNAEECLFIVESREIRWDFFRKSVDLDWKEYYWNIFERASLILLFSLVPLFIIILVMKIVSWVRRGT